MATGLGFKEFVTGEILSAAAANGYLASQTVMVFATPAARTTAITTPFEGMTTYIKSTKTTETYSGTAWVLVNGGSGMKFISTTTFSAATAVSVNNCFSSEFNTYLITFFTVGSGGQGTMKLRVGAVDNSLQYFDTKLATSGATGTTVTGSAQINVTTGWKIWPALTQSQLAVQIIVTNPNLASPTFYNGMPSYGSTSAPSYGLDISSGQHGSATAFDGFTVAFTSATTGTIRIYGLEDA